MKSALLDLITSKKFLTALTAVIVYVAGRFGFDVDTAVLDRVYLALLAYVGAQGIADHGKEAAKVYVAASVPAAVAAQVAALTAARRAVADPLATIVVAPEAVPRSSAGAALTLGLLACAAIATGGLASGCGATGADVKEIAKGVIDCTAPDRKAVIAQFEPTLEQLLVSATSADGTVDWAPIKAAAKTFAVDLGGCALASAVAILLHPPAPQPGAPDSAALVIDPVTLRAGFDALRKEQFAGAAFHTERGDL